MTLDIQLFHFFNNFAGQSRIFDTLIVFLAEYLQYVLVAAFLMLLYFAAYSRREKLYIFWTTIISIVVARFVITEIIRFFYHRPRPFLALEAHKLIANSDWFYSDTEWSFPSGHSAFFFAMATAIYLYNKKWGIGFFIAAILMNVSRIIAGVHYPSDILGGAIIGIVVGRVAFHFVEKRKPIEMTKTEA
jgi:undecaprenyl-diphosphatase